MFKKTRERIAKLEQDHESIHKVVQHFDDHSEAYLAGAGCLVVGYVFRGRKCPDVVQTFTDSNDNIAPIVNRSKNVKIVTQYLNQRNYNARPVRCLETGVEWPSQAEAAEAMGIAAWIISQHLTGKFEDAKGFHFERVTA